MSINSYPGICFRCVKQVPPGKGDFQITSSVKKLKGKIAGRWLIRCHGCKYQGNGLLETSPFINLIKNEK